MYWDRNSGIRHYTYDEEDLDRPDSLFSCQNAALSYGLGFIGPSRDLPRQLDGDRTWHLMSEEHK
jgi:hypothetical protein